MSAIHTPQKPELDLRMLAFPGIMASLISVLFMRLWYFQVVKAPELVERADATRSVAVTSPAPRGLIFDREGNVIAGIRQEIVITAIPSQVKKHPEVIAQVADILGVDVKKLQAKLKEANSRPYLPSPIYVGATSSAGVRVAEAGDELPGIGAELQPMRYYPDSTSFTHVLGYVWTPDTKDVERITKLGKKPAEFVGKAGIERAFEADLMGDPGSEKQEVDAKRRPVRIVARDAPNPGDQLVLSLDSRLQKYATKYMADHQFVGAVVALDPKTGEILCLVSSPTYDQNLFNGGISQADWAKLTTKTPDNPLTDEPLLDRAIRSSYAPGSTFKIVTSIASYEAGKFDPEQHFFCDGGVRIGKAFFGCLGHHGSLGYYDAMAKSCNSYFYQLGRAAGEVALRKACEDVGLGQKSGLEIGGEWHGIVPTEEYVKKVRKDGKWYGGDTLNFAIGQGFVEATPLQLANLAALVANNGTNYVPHLVHEIRRSGTSGPGTRVESQVFKHVDAAPEFWAALQKALIGVMDHGTASASKIPNVVWAGKTGSAEHGKDKNAKANAVFVGYAPADDPKIAICVLIEGVGHGGDFAAPPARDIVQAYLTDVKSRGLPKSPASVSAADASAGSPVAR